MACHARAAGSLVKFMIRFFPSLPGPAGTIETSFLNPTVIWGCCTHQISERTTGAAINKGIIEPQTRCNPAFFVSANFFFGFVSLFFHLTFWAWNG